MLQVFCEDLLPGMVVARPILDAANRILLAQGQVLTEYYIRRIRELSVGVIFVEDGMGLEEPPGPVSWETAAQAARVLKRNYESCLRTGQLQMSEIRSQVDQIIEELLVNRSTMIGMAGLKSHDEYTYQHSVHVCILAVMMGISRGFNRLRVRDLGVGAMLHDIGKLFIPREILNKADQLTDQEWELIQNHTWEGYNLIRRSDQVTLLSAHVALQHHERLNGEGYPRSLLGESIHEYAQITSVADIFDALVSDRPYRAAHSNQEALVILEGYRNGQLSSELIDLLSMHINPYPIGTMVELSSGETAIVAGYDPDNTDRPPVKIIFSANGEYYRSNILALSGCNNVNIRRILDRQEGGKLAARYLSMKISASITS